MESELEALNYYLNEVKDSSGEFVEIEDDQHVQLNEVEEATDFLQKAGLINLTNLYKQGREITANVINDSVLQRNLTEKQAQTIKSRIDTLNKTLRNRQPRRKYRHDIRDVTWNLNEKTSDAVIRSRSTTPNSLDSLGHLNDDHTISDDDQQITSLPSFPLDSSQQHVHKTKLKWTCSEPLQQQYNNKKFTNRADVAHLGSENVILKGYQPLQEYPSIVIKSPIGGIVQRERSGSDPTTEITLTNKQPSSNGSSRFYLSRSHSNLSATTASSLYSQNDENFCNNDNDDDDDNNGPISFEMIKKENDIGTIGINDSEMGNDGGTSIEEFNDSEYQYLKPLVFVELVAIFDQYQITYIRRKSSMKNKGGNVFGVNLSTLVMRDMPRPSDTAMVPQIIRTVIHQLNERWIREDGILRVACQKHKLEMLCNEIEAKFFVQRSYIEQIVEHQSTVHELTGVLKKILRELPDPIFTMELFDMFYKTSLITNMVDRVRALNLLVLLLPIEHRNTFKLLLDFLLNIVKHEKENRMSLHNVAMITAPSFFPARLLLPKDNKMAMKQLSKEELTKQINGAAVCCCIMETMLKTGLTLWTVPKNLVCQAKEVKRKPYNKKDIHRINEKRIRCGKSKLIRSSSQYETGAIHSPRNSTTRCFC